MAANTKYKDSVFSFLFNDPDNLRKMKAAQRPLAEIAEFTGLSVETINNIANN